MAEEIKEAAVEKGRAIFKIAKGTSHKKTASGIHHLFSNNIDIVELHAIGVLPISQSVKTFIELKRLVFAEIYSKTLSVDICYTTKIINEKEVSVTIFQIKKM
jgi:hypothetical protein